jgi:uncharacterized integral membrane protein (TIGR00697 family)
MASAVGDQATGSSSIRDSETAQWVRTLSFALFVTAVIGSIPLSVKVHSFDFLGGVLIPSGTILFSLSYLATDIICELDGRRSAFQVVVAGLVMRVFFSLMMLFSLYGEFVPGVSNAAFWSSENNSAFEFVLGSSQMIVVGGIIAFAISSFVDVSIYAYLKNAHSGKNLMWVRNNVSTIVAQVVGTVVFVLIAFSQRVPIEGLVSLIYGQVIFKALFALLDTPLLYLARNIASGRRIFDFSG